MPDENLKIASPGWRNPAEKIFLQRAQKEKWAIGQFNISNAETLKAILLAAQKLKSPVIIGTSEGESRFLGLKQAAGLVRAWQEETGLPIWLNLDHGKSFGYIKEAAEAGYDSVHFDGSDLPLAKNIAITKQVMSMALTKGILVEGEVGSIKGSSTMLDKTPKVSLEDLSDPEEVDNFCRKTQVDLLALSIGTFHGVSREKNRPERIDFERLAQIKSRLPGTFLVLHGASGVSSGDIKKAVQCGVNKFNVNTELRVAYADSLRKALRQKSKELIPYKYLPAAISAVQAVVEEKIKLFGSNNKV